MATFDYSRSAASAKRLLDRFGQPIVLLRQGAGAYDADTGTVTRSGQSHTGVGVLLNYEQRDIDGSVIQEGDQHVLLSAVGMPTPQSGDTLTLDDGRTFFVMASRPLAPAGVVVLHELHARGI